jgi:hypothetical protein
MAIPVIAAVVGIWGAVDSHQQSVAARKDAEKRINDAEAKTAAEKQAAIQSAEAQRAKKQQELLTRQGRTASLLTSSRGLDQTDQLGNISRPLANIGQI